VQWIDQNATTKAVAANPASVGFVNYSVPACDADKIKLLTGGAITDGSSLFCNATPGVPAPPTGYNSLRTGADVNTWAFADGVHPTTGGHKVISDSIRKQLQAAGWI
jgi:phospholipase/lecithinase/hemolysin